MWFLAPMIVISADMFPLAVSSQAIPELPFTVNSVLPEETTHRLHSSSFSGLPYRILNRNPKKELLWSL